MDKLIRILEALHPDVDFANTDGLVDKKILDSFDIINIITEISEEFDVVVPAEEIAPENFNSARALWSLIERLENE
ncbi:MAG: acyl carrier protein [Eubacteriales bacterium]|nr:acyl carrier protein [Eubacteriales bacterium]